MATELFEDIFEVRQLNPDGKKFDKGAWRDAAAPGAFCSVGGALEAELSTDE
jgi:hypothetical protein